MKPSLGIGIGVLALAGVLSLDATAGEGTYEKVVKDMLTKVEDITKTLATIKDKTSADAARPQLKEAATKTLELRKQAEEMKQPSKEEKDRLAKEYAPKFEVAVKKLRDETLRVQGVPGAEDALAELAVLKDKKEKKDDK